MEDIKFNKPCPVCNNTELAIGECKYKDKIIAYNVYCPICNFTGRSYKMRYKAIKKWEYLYNQVKHINDGGLKC